MAVGNQSLEFVFGPSVEAGGSRRVFDGFEEPLKGRWDPLPRWRRSEARKKGLLSPSFRMARSLGDTLPDHFPFPAHFGRREDRRGRSGFHDLRAKTQSLDAKGAKRSAPMSSKGLGRVSHWNEAQRLSRVACEGFHSCPGTE